MSVRPSGSLHVGFQSEVVEIWIPPPRSSDAVDPQRKARETYGALTQLLLCDHVFGTI
jgi:hypothetical protein